MGLGFDTDLFEEVEDEDGTRELVDPVAIAAGGGPAGTPPPAPVDEPEGPRPPGFIGVTDFVVTGYDETGAPIVEPFQAQRRVPGGITREAPGFAPPEFGLVPPRYREGDQDNILNGWTQEDRFRLQLQLEAAGLLKADSYRLGWWDNASRSAFKQVLGFANRHGYNWGESLSLLIQNPVGRPSTGGGRGPRAPAFSYLPPDMDQLAQTVKDAFRGILGREAKDWEMVALSDKLKDEHRASFDAQVAVAQAEFEAARRGESGEIALPEDLTDVNIADRFKEHFESRYSAEIGLIDRQSQAALNTQRLTGNLSGLNRMAGASV